ncbi:MAG: hypothetical protein MUC87_03185 [Bacteroidia bacterium]|jgi:hypothetical protein|nr:hypothetical protein [Bacteroidia bacterium]
MKLHLSFTLTCLTLFNVCISARPVNIIDFRAGIHATTVKTDFSTIYGTAVNSPLFTHQFYTTRKTPVELFFSCETAKRFQFQLGGGIQSITENETSIVPKLVQGPTPDSIILSFNTVRVITKSRQFIGHAAINWMFYRSEKAAIGIGLYGQTTSKMRDSDLAISIPVQYNLYKRSRIYLTPQLNTDGRFRLLAGCCMSLKKNQSAIPVN